MILAWSSTVAIVTSTKSSYTSGISVDERIPGEISKATEVRLYQCRQHLAWVDEELPIVLETYANTSPFSIFHSAKLMALAV